MNSKSEYFTYQKTQELAKNCRINGLPVTRQRQAVLEALAGRSDHPSADDLFDEVKEQVRGISRTTVYRVLETLVRIGVIQKISTQEPRARFDADTRRHHHILCLGCGKLQDVDGDHVKELIPSTPELKGFRLMNYSVQFTGLCSECLASAETLKSVASPIPTTIEKEES